MTTESLKTKPRSAARVAPSVLVGIGAMRRGEPAVEAPVDDEPVLAE